MAFANRAPCIDCLLSLLLFQENILPRTPPSPTERLQFHIHFKFFINVITTHLIYWRANCGWLFIAIRIWRKGRTITISVIDFRFTLIALNSHWFYRLHIQSISFGVSRSCIFRFEYTCYGLNGHSPHPLKPLTRFSHALMLSEFMSCFRIPEKSSFGRVPCFLPRLVCFQSRNKWRHSLFSGAKKATSRGWSRCVEFGSRHTKLMLLSLQAFITDSLRWEDKLSPINTFFPCCFFQIWK